MDIGKIEYRVRPVTRYVVTRFHEDAAGKTGGSSVKGEYDNADMAYEVGYALCKEEHERLGLPPSDERIQYPQHPGAPSIHSSGAAGMKMTLVSTA